MNNGVDPDHRDTPVESSLEVRMPVTSRLKDRIKREFPEDFETICSLLHEAEEGSLRFERESRERILAAVIMLSQGNVDRFFDALEEMEQDWRDLLMTAGLGHEDWESKVDDYLAPDEP